MQWMENDESRERVYAELETVKDAQFVLVRPSGEVFAFWWDGRTKGFDNDYLLINRMTIYGAKCRNEGRSEAANRLGIAGPESPPQSQQAE